MAYRSFAIALTMGLTMSLTMGLSVAMMGCAAAPTATSFSANKPASPVTTVSPNPASPSPSLSEQAQLPGLPNQAQSLPITAIAEIGETSIQLEVAQTPDQQALGLMYRTELADDRGMLFPFDRPRFTRFWMRNVEISLDMIFMMNDEVVAIAENVPPCTTTPCPTYGPDTPVTQVIELRGGRAAELGLSVGDRITITAISSPDATSP